MFLLLKYKKVFSAQLWLYIQYIFGRDYTHPWGKYIGTYRYNVAIACVLVEVVFDEQLSEFGALVVDSNGKASIVAGAIMKLLTMFRRFSLFILLRHLTAVMNLNIISGINRFIAAIHFLQKVFLGILFVPYSRVLRYRSVKPSSDLLRGAHIAQAPFLKSRLLLRSGVPVYRFALHHSVGTALVDSFHRKKQYI